MVGAKFRCFRGEGTITYDFTTPAKAIEPRHTPRHGGSTKAGRVDGPEHDNRGGDDRYGRNDVHVSSQIVANIDLR